MKNVSGREFAKALEQRGWVLLRIHGSHNVYAKTGTRHRISMPVHGNSPLKHGLLNHLIKLAGLRDLDE